MLAAMPMTQCLAYSSPREAYTVWGWSGWHRSQWISSLIRNTPWARHRSPTRCNSARVHTRPTGLWGEQRIMAVVVGRDSLSSRSSKSIS